MVSGSRECGWLLDVVSVVACWAGLEIVVGEYDCSVRLLSVVGE